ncbi:MAG: tetratricopeptide repeat protein, partial [Syntrophobacteraceae bacterium]
MKRAGLLLILAALILSGCASTGAGSGLTVSQLQQMGEKYLAAGDTPVALKYLTEAEAKRPGSAIIQYDLGLAYNQRGLLNEAATHLQKALQIQPSYPEALNALGAVYAERGQVELAQEAFQKALADPFYQTPQLAAYNLGRLYEKKGDNERALKEYEQAVRFQPTYGVAWYRIGQILETMRRGDEARNAYGKAVAGAPDLAEAHLRYGEMSYLAGDMEAALFSLNRVTKLVPNTSMADEAKRHLERLRGVVTQPAPRTPSSRRVSPADIDVISRYELQNRQAISPSAAPVEQPPIGSPDSYVVTPRQKPAAAKGEFVTAPVQTPAPVPAPAPGAAPVEARVKESPPAPPGDVSVGAVPHSPA